MLCAKVEAGKTICMPPHSDGQCNRESVACRSAGGGGGLVASPAPVVFDADDDEEANTYLNANLKVFHADVKSASQLPDADAFAKALAHITHLQRSKVNVVTEWGSTAKVKSAASTTATLHATFEVKSRGKR